MESIEDAYPLNATHSGILFHSLQSDASDDYLAVIHMRIVGALDVPCLQRAWCQVIDHHTSLRSGIVCDGLEEPLWVVHQSIEPEWEQHDYSRLSPEAQDDELKGALDRLVQWRFSFNGEPLLKFSLFKIDDRIYRLLWTVHHLISDGWSTAVVLEDLVCAYASFADGHPVDLKETLPYKQYLDWQSARSPEATRSYWSEYLSDINVTPLQLADRGNRSVVSDSVTTSMTLGAELHAKLGLCARRHRTTTSTLLLAAWGLVLRDYTQRSAPMFGVTVAGRPAQLAGVERTVGLFISTLPLCIDLTVDKPIADWLAELATTLQSHAEHAAQPLIEMHKLAGRSAGEALFDSVVAIEGHESDLCFASQKSSGIAIDSIDYRIRSHFKLSLLVATGGKTTLQLISQIESFDTVANQAMLNRYISVLHTLVADEIETPAQWRAAGPKAAGVSLAPPPQTHSRIDQWILQSARRQPTKPALIQGQVSISYAVLERRAMSLAAAISHSQTDHSGPVAICLDFGVDAIVAMLAVLLAGRGYLPLDPEQPVARREALCTDAQCSLLIARDDTSMQMSTPSIRVLGASFEDTAVALPVIPMDHASTLAYLMYTSGSTGEPKGVPISHANLIYSTEARFAYYPESVDKFLLVSPLTFDSSVVGIYWTLCSGGTLVLPDTEQRREVAHWCDLVRVHRVTHTLCLPSVYRLILSRDSNRDLSSLRSVIVAGEACDADLCRLHHERLPDAALYNEYGPTEACVWSSVHRCRPTESTAVPIGLPIPGTHMDVIGLDGAGCPDGVEGELTIYSPGVAEGYFQKPELTRHFFIGGKSGYRTGDRGYRSPATGFLYCTGRVDRQIKVRGQRIEPAEIEHHVRDIAQVRAVRAFAVPGADDRPVRLWVAVAPSSIAQSEVERVLHRQLPKAMWPHGFLIIDQLPTLSNGKISEQALCEMVANSQGAMAAQQTQLAPATDNAMEARLLEIVNRLLDGESLAATDSLKSHGLDSIDAMKLTAQLREIFSVDLRLSAVLSARNSRELSSHIARLEKASESSAASADLQALDREATSVLSAEQMQLWYLEQFGLAPEVYAVQSAFEYRGSLCMRALQYALDAIVCRHEILRTRLMVNDQGEPQQHVHPPQPVELAVIDLPRGEPWDHTRARQLKNGFDLSRDQLLRAALLRRETDENLLMLHSHHIALDGWSFRLLLTQFWHYYRQFTDRPADGAVSGGLLPMPEPDRYQYRDYALWQSARDPKTLQPVIEHWCGVLAEPREPIRLPLDFNRPARASYRGGSHVRAIGRRTIQRWRQIADERQATPFVVALAAVKTGLRRVTGNRDLLIGTPVANRDQPRWQETLGFFSNTIIIRTQCPATATFTDSVDATRNAVLDVLNHPVVPLAEIVRALDVPRQLDRNPLFDVFFVYQPEPAESPGIPGVEILAAQEPALEGAKFDLAIEIRATAIDGESEFDLHLNYNRDLFLESTIERIANEMLAIMLATSSHATTALDQFHDQSVSLELSSIYGRPTVDENVPGKTLAPDRGLLVNRRLDEVFDARCQCDDMRLALRHNGREANYATVADGVDRMATCLAAAGLQAGEVVAVALPRSIHQICVALAVLRCGAIWCPIDPQYPESRQRFMLDNCTARFLIGEAATVTPATIGQIGIDVGQPIEQFKPQLQHAVSRPVDSAAASRYKHGAAALIYTSGSTGDPKGVLLGHQAIMNRLVWMWTQYPFADHDINAIRTSSSFVDCIWEMFGALLAGVPSVLIDEDTVTDVPMFIETLQREAVTRLLIVPSLLSSMLDVLPARAQPLASLRLCSCSGEVLPPALAQRFLTLLPHSRLLNLYGSSEVAADVCCHEVVANDTLNEIPLGVPISGMQVCIVDAQRRLLPAGQTGEIAISGPGLAIGYLADEDLTATRFISIESLGRVFLSGDRGYLDDCGRMVFQGRDDRQIKVRGVRIDCREIERHVDAHRGIARSHVFTTGELEDRQLCVALQADQSLADDSIPDDQALRRWLQQRLAHWQIPDRFTFIEPFALLPNGKLDRAAIEARCRRAAGQHKQSIASPLNEHPEQLAARLTDQAMLSLWQSVLRNSGLVVTDDFFDAGGYSLLAVKLVARINAELLAGHQVDMSIGDLIEWRNVATTQIRLNERIHQAGLPGHTARSSALMTLQRSIEPGQVFMVPPFGHTGFYLQTFASCLPADFSVYSFDTALSLEHDTMERFCTVLVDQLLQEQPHGPWTLVALCLGNVVAHEMARQLKARTGGHSNLYLIDGSPPLAGPDWRDEIFKLPIELTGPRRYWTILRREFDKDFCKSIIDEKIRQFRSIYDSGVRRYIEVQQAQSRHYRSYIGVTGSADITFIRSRTFIDMPRDAERWAKLTTGSYRVVDLPWVRHASLVRRHSQHWKDLVSIILQHEPRPVTADQAKRAI